MIIFSSQFIYFIFNSFFFFTLHFVWDRTFGSFCCIQVYRQRYNGRGPYLTELLQSVATHLRRAGGDFYGPGRWDSGPVRIRANPIGRGKLLGILGACRWPPSGPTPPPPPSPSSPITRRAMGLAMPSPAKGTTAIRSQGYSSSGISGKSSS